jgi:NhaA family Na+:H+ antiporter
MAGRSNTSERSIPLPEEPVDRILAPLARFLHVEAASGIVLLACTVAALILANSPWSDRFLAFWKTTVGFQIGSFEMRHSLQHWINDGLMAIFFFVIGLEVKRELVIGELRELRRAVLPIAAALGGMLAPAGIYLALQLGRPGQPGWGIPMATDIAFVVGCMALLGPRIPHGLRVMLLSLAIADDIGAILVIAVGYTEAVQGGALLLGLLGIAAIFTVERLGVRSFPAYTLIGILVWLAFHQSGVHATIAGVILGLMTPARSYLSEGRFGEVLHRAGQVFQGGGWKTERRRAEKIRRFQWAARETIPPLEYLEHTLHPWVGFVIMPVFALANAGVPVHLSDLGAPVAMAVAAGLVVGKPAGIVLLSWLAVRLNVGKLPEGVTWRMIVAGGSLAGIGFTMALFIAGLALGDPLLLDTAKIGVLMGSLLSATIGMALLALFLPRTPEEVGVDQGH